MVGIHKIGRGVKFGRGVKLGRGVKFGRGVKSGRGVKFGRGAQLCAPTLRNPNFFQRLAPLHLTVT
ncbi:hypothetical protein [Scytonema millei]|uniref:Uncharacterized protein n=1 Tax=Scytonema millei VB511283 TaxID=1245923 RepID=A0A9X5E398_9CYAN|nr:hypothetical protein [Scytonema millei]NHC33993.1 hypothetical protein [Scytonema millei VB511283]